jgi:sarcosine/dimethylglycine N-methyltransferase
VTPEELRKNYNAIGIAIIEDIYGTPGYLSPAGAEGTDRLAELTKIHADDKILDVGSGIGGPAMRLAKTHGCDVTGLDLVESSVTLATERAAQAGIDGQVRFEAGDATAMPFDADAFSMVWSQDAWCHIPDRDTLLSECRRVLKPGGTIAFADWLLTGDPQDRQYLDDVLSALASPGLETLESYKTRLASHGFTNIVAEDVSASFGAQYDAIMARLHAEKDRISDKFGARVFEIVEQKNGDIHHAFKVGQIGGGRFTATLPG